MKATLFRLAWWLARKTTPANEYGTACVKIYNDEVTRIDAISVIAVQEDNTADALVALAEAYETSAHSARQEAAKRRLTEELATPVGAVIQ